MAVGLGGAVRGLNRPSPRPCAGHVAIVSYLQGVLNIVHRTTDAKAPVTSGNTPDINKHPPPPVIPHTPACKPLLSPYEQFPPLLTLISLPLSHQWCFPRTAGGCTADLWTGWCMFTTHSTTSNSSRACTGTLTLTQGQRQTDMRACIYTLS